LKINNLAGHKKFRLAGISAIASTFFTPMVLSYILFSRLYW
jgi:hypothetical protein